MVKNKLAFIFFLQGFIFMSACALAADESKNSVPGEKSVSYGTLLSQNQANILKLSLGLTKEQVVEIMGSNRSNVKSTSITNPFKKEFFTIGKDEYEVLHYLTRRYPAYTAVKESQATPVILKNGKVIGLGTEALKQTKGGKRRGGSE